MQPRNDPIIFYKEESEPRFVATQTIKLLTEEEFKKDLKSESPCTLVTIFNALHSNLFGEFTGNLVDIKLDKQKLEPLIEEGIKLGTLCIRFLNLFVEKIGEGFWMKLLECSLKNASSSNFLALLDLPFSLSHSEPVLSYDQQNILNAKYKNEFNLLEFVIHQNNFDALKICLKLGTDVNKTEDILF